MSKIFLTLVSIIILLISAGNLCAQAELTIPDKSFDFGFIPQNSKINCDFWLKSTGSDTLIITRVKPGCGCTKAPLKKSVLSPGDSTQLEIIFDSKKYKGKSSKSIRIYSNASDVSDRLTIKSFVVENIETTSPVVITPYKLNISQFGEKPRKKMEFIIKNVTNNDLELAIIFQPDGFFDIELPKKIKAGKTATGKISIKENDLSVEFDKSFTIEFNDVNQSRFSIPVTRTVRMLGMTSSE